MTEVMEARDAQSAADPAATTEMKATSSPKAMYPDQSMDNLQNDDDDDIKSNGSKSHGVKPDSIDMGQSPLSQSTTEVSATPHMSEEEVPMETPLILQVSSDKGDTLVTMGSPTPKVTPKG